MAARVAKRGNNIPGPSIRASRIPPPSGLLVDLHVYLVPRERWLVYRRLPRVQLVEDTVSLGFVRVIPHLSIFSLRRELGSQLGPDLLPRDYIFIRCVGRNFAQVKPRQERELKVKNFLPPYAHDPEIFILELLPYDDLTGVGVIPGVPSGVVPLPPLDRCEVSAVDALDLHPRCKHGRARRSWACPFWMPPTSPTPPPTPPATSPTSQHLLLSTPSSSPTPLPTTPFPGLSQAPDVPGQQPQQQLDQLPLPSPEDKEASWPSPASWPTISMDDSGFVPSPPAFVQGPPPAFVSGPPPPFCLACLSLTTNIVTRSVGEDDQLRGKGMAAVPSAKEMQMLWGLVGNPPWALINPPFQENPQAVEPMRTEEGTGTERLVRGSEDTAEKSAPLQPMFTSLMARDRLNMMYANTSGDYAYPEGLSGETTHTCLSGESTICDGQSGESTFPGGLDVTFPGTLARELASYTIGDVKHPEGRRGDVKYPEGHRDVKYPEGRRGDVKYPEGRRGDVKYPAELTEDTFPGRLARVVAPYPRRDVKYPERLSGEETFTAALAKEMTSYRKGDVKYPERLTVSGEETFTAALAREMTSFPEGDVKYPEGFSGELMYRSGIEEDITFLGGLSGDMFPEGLSGETISEGFSGDVMYLDDLPFTGQIGEMSLPLGQGGQKRTEKRKGEIPAGQRGEIVYRTVPMRRMSSEEPVREATFAGGRRGEMKFQERPRGERTLPGPTGREMAIPKELRRAKTYPEENKGEATYPVELAAQYKYPESLNQIGEAMFPVEPKGDQRGDYAFYQGQSGKLYSFYRGPGGTYSFYGGQKGQYRYAFRRGQGGQQVLPQAQTEQSKVSDGQSGDATGPTGPSGEETFPEGQIDEYPDPNDSIEGEPASGGSGVKGSIGEQTEQTRDYASQVQIVTKRERLLAELSDVVQGRQAAELRRAELVDRANDLYGQVREKRDRLTQQHERWRQKYVEELTGTRPLEDTCTTLRAELNTLHRRLLAHLEGRDLPLRVRDGPSKKANYKITAARLQHEIKDLQQKVKTAKLRLDSESKLKSQAVREVRDLRNELSQKKAVFSVARSHQVAAYGWSRDPLGIY